MHEPATHFVATLAPLPVPADSPAAGVALLVRAGAVAGTDGALDWEGDGGDTEDVMGQRQAPLLPSSTVLNAAPDRPFPAPWDLPPTARDEFMIDFSIIKFLRSTASSQNAEGRG